MSPDEVLPTQGGLCSTALAPVPAPEHTRSPFPAAARPQLGTQTWSQHRPLALAPPGCPSGTPGRGGPQASHTPGDTHSCPGIPSLLIPALPAASLEPGQTSASCPQSPSVCAPHCPQRVPVSLNARPRPRRSRPGWRFAQPPRNPHLLRPPQPLTPALGDSPHRGGRRLPPAHPRPVKQGREDTQLPRNTSSHGPTAGTTDRQTPLSLPQKSPVCNQEGHPGRPGPATSDGARARRARTAGWY